MYKVTGAYTLLFYPGYIGARYEHDNITSIGLDQ